MQVLDLFNYLFALTLAGQSTRQYPVSKEVNSVPGQVQKTGPVVAMVLEEEEFVRIERAILGATNSLDPTSDSV